MLIELFKAKRADGRNEDPFCLYSIDSCQDNATAMTRRASSSNPRSDQNRSPANIDHYYCRRIPKPTVSSAPLPGWPEARGFSLARLPSRCERILRLTRKEGTNLTQKDFIEPQRDLAGRQYYGLCTRTVAMTATRERICHKNRRFWEISSLWNVPSKLLG